jgi:stearoyl-CoA desaturase (delta-9 desaturase)
MNSADTCESVQVEEESTGDRKAPAKKFVPKRLARPDAVGKHLIWSYLLVFIIFHLMIPLAFVPYFFSWTGLILFPLGHMVFDWLGIGLCFHRTLTHNSLVMPKWLEHTFAMFGVFTLMDSPARWVAIHRKHHQTSDHHADPHSPLVSFWWGHVEWLYRENQEMSDVAFYHRYAPDVLRDRFYLTLERRDLWVWLYFAHALVYFVIGLVCGWVWSGNYWDGLQFGLSLLLWGVVLRTLLSWHATFAVNSMAHRWGYRNYETRDNSQNNWVTAVLTGGDGWHNNHHAHPVLAAHGHRWWEFDATYIAIRILEFLGLAKQVKRQD